MVRSSFRRLGEVDTEELSYAISRYDELVLALMLRCGELETRLAMPPPPPPSSNPLKNTAANASQMQQVAPTAAPRTTKVRETWWFDLFALGQRSPRSTAVPLTLGLSASPFVSTVARPLPYRRFVGSFTTPHISPFLR